MPELISIGQLFSLIDSLAFRLSGCYAITLDIIFSIVGEIVIGVFYQYGYLRFADRPNLSIAVRPRNLQQLGNTKLVGRVVFAAEPTVPSDPLWRRYPGPLLGLPILGQNVDAVRAPIQNNSPLQKTHGGLLSPHYIYVEFATHLSGA